MSRRMIPDAATVGLWRLDEAAGGNAVDVGPNGLTGTNYGSTAIAVVGLPFAYARHFVRSSTQYILVPHNAALHPATITVEMWANLAADSVGEGLADKYGSGGWETYKRADNKIAMYLNAAGGQEVNTPIVAGAMTYYALTFDGRYIRVFVNGVLANTNDLGSTYSIVYGGTPTLKIGMIWDNTHNLNGDLAEIRVSNRARTTWEIYNTWQGLQARDPVAGFGVES